MAGATNPEHRVQIDSVGPPPSQLPAHLLMLLSQLLSGIYYVVTRLALINGMNRIVLSLYRDILAMFILIPAAYFIDKGNRVKLSWDVVLQLLLLGLTGIYGSNYLLFVGIEYTSAEVSAAIQPFIPAVTAIIAIVFGVEVVYWRRRDGRAKVLGIVASCIGAIVLTLYRGPAVLSKSNNMGQGQTGLGIASLKETGFAGIETLQSTRWPIADWQFGVFCLIGNCLCMASFINLQAPLLKRFPAPVSILAYSYGFGALLMGLTGYFAVTDPSDWTLSFDINLLVVIYNGVIASAFNFAIMTWCLARVGPLFVASYIPVQPIIAACLSLVFLGTTLYLGSIVGSVLVISGLLLVSWSREETYRLSYLSHQIDSHPPLFKRGLEAMQEPLLQVGH